MDAQKKIDRLMERIKDVLKEEREANANDPLIVSLITRIENKTAIAFAEVNETP